MDTDATTPFHIGYRRWLDGMRGVAILMVLAFHLRFLGGGSLGVDIFFVLSGFLITALLMEEWQETGSISLKRFYLRRALRLLPAFGALLLVCGILSFYLAPDAARELRKEMLVAGLYVSNWPTLHGVNMATLGHTWSLSIEEQFYLLWPPILLYMLWKKFSTRKILQVVCTGIITAALVRMVIFHLRPTIEPDKTGHTLNLYIALYARADSLLVGCVVGLLASRNLLPKSPDFVKKTGIASLVSVVVLAYFAWRRTLASSQYYDGMFTVVAAMVGVIIVRLLSAPSRWASILLESAPLVGIGRISYALYLYHMPIIHWLVPSGLGSKYPRESLLAVALTFAAAIASYYLIERPALRLKNRFRPIKAAPATPLVPPIPRNADAASPPATV